LSLKLRYPDTARFAWESRLPMWRSTAGIASSEARLISSRPERVEELDWRISQLSDGAKPDSVREILFRFYNGALFEMMITYDRDQTGGLTDVDMTEALAAIYGPARPPAVKEIGFNSGYNHVVRAIAEWRDTNNLMNLVGFAYGGGFGVVVSATGDQILARQALLESERLDRAEAPQRALDLRAKEVADTQARDEKSRSLTGPGLVHDRRDRGGKSLCRTGRGLSEVPAIRQRAFIERLGIDQECSFHD
jgi:hypothetical protein